MGRLTEKYIDRDGIVQYQNACGINEFEYCGGREDIFNKLGQLEDVEEELGIELKILFKALTKKLASLYKNQKGKWVVKPLLYDYVLTPKEFVEMNLTKEELE